MHDATPSLHFAMKTATKAAATGSSHSYSQPYQSPCQTHSHSHTLSRSSHSQRPSKTGSSTTPIASPCFPYSVGQNNPPQRSPGRNPEFRSSSPNYFGLVVEHSSDSRQSPGFVGNHWSPPTSSVKSFGAAIPTQVPLDANPEFEAFKRQVDFNRNKAFSLSPNHVQATSHPGLARPRAPRWHTHASDTGSDVSFVHAVSAAHHSTNKMDVDQDSLHDSAYVSAESKRNSESSLLPLQLGGQLARFESPRSMDASQQRTSLTRAEDRDPRLSIMEHKFDPPAPCPGDVSRASTLPIKLDSGAPPMISGDQLKDMMEQLGPDRLLLLDIRSAQNYATSRIKGALNLCIPTTLLKRATFNTHKLYQTFQGGKNSEKFSKWREASAIVVYDAHSSDQRDAVTPKNMIKKFTSEGFTGKTCVLKGGFSVFKETNPELVDNMSPADTTGKSCNASDATVAPVIGGVTLPVTANGINPFFSNIRQNMDLADGVGQFKVARPQGLESPLLPTWLRKAASEPDQGKRVSERFLQIEKDEKSRMQSAYAAFDPHTAQQNHCVQLCGVEKGGKNRYKDILPFEHARVRLQNKPKGSCDYVNASYLRSSRSNKRYIATQGPLPATFEDFWSVIWEQDVRVIVMLTAESEGGQLKCHPYWKERDYGPIRLKPLSEKNASLDIDKHRSSSSTSLSGLMGDSGRRRANTATPVDSSTSTPQPVAAQSDAPYVTIRKFALTHAAHPFAPMREITQLHFASWPDFGTPAQPSHLLALVELANVMQRASMPLETASIVGSGRPTDQPSINLYDQPESDAKARPMLVHCSAGCGRTGTFCAVDSVVDMLKRQLRDNGSLTKARDIEGDVTMGDTNEGVSPKTNKPMDFDEPFKSGIGSHHQSVGSSSIDTSWLGDEAVDLIQKTVEDFRQQRLSMVQTLRQFVLCYETVLEWAHRMNGRGASPLRGRARGSSLLGPLRD